MKIYLGADHNGFEFKKELASFLVHAGYDVVDDGGLTFSKEDDFPQFAGKVAASLLGDGDKESRGILVCGSGQGLSMAANRFKGIRASLCWNLDEARSARNDDDSNVLCLSSKYLSLEDTKSIVMTWLNTPFAGAPRFIRRLQQLDQLT
jgi:ribose 5-phosphate isomerase B